MARYLHLITNSRSSWNSLVCMHDRAKQEFYCWRAKLRTLNEILFSPVPFGPFKVLFSDASPTGHEGFIQGSALFCRKKLSPEESQKSYTWRELVAINFALEVFDNRL